MVPGLGFRGAFGGLGFERKLKARALLPVLASGAAAPKRAFKELRVSSKGV